MYYHALLCILMYHVLILLLLLVSLCSLALREHNLTEWAGRIFKADSQKFSVGVNSLRVISRQAGRDFKVDSPKFSSRVVDIIFIKIYRPINVLPAVLWNYRNAMTFPRYELFLNVSRPWRDRQTDRQVHRRTDTQTDRCLPIMCRPIFWSKNV